MFSHCERQRDNHNKKDMHYEIASFLAMTNERKKPPSFLEGF